MHILHVLFTAASGGIEQAFLDTTQALAAQGHRVSVLIRPDAPYRQQVGAAAEKTFLAKPRGFYDIKAVWHARKVLARARPDLIIAHAPRAVSLMHVARLGSGIPLCGVVHSYKTARLRGADALVALTPDMKEAVAKSGYAANRIHVIPNMLRQMPRAMARKRGQTPVIGALTRLAPEKRMDDFLRALQLLKGRNVAFEARIGGSGPQEAHLRALARSLKLDGHVHWDGWVTDKAGFFEKLDMYCMPSEVESFGIALLEAMAHGVPPVAADAPGPASIISHSQSGLVVPRGDVVALADALQKLCEDTKLTGALREGALARAQDYRFEAVAGQWDKLVALMTSKATPAPKG